MIGDSIATYIASALAPCHYEGLLSRSAVAAICRAQATSFPATVTSLFGFECHLGCKEPIADFLVRTGATSDEWPELERTVAEREGEVWRRIEAVLRQRRDPDSPLADRLQNLWLEYDLADYPTASTAPSVFFGTGQLTRNAEIGWATELVATLSGEPLSHASVQTVNKIVAALPGATRLFQIGIMCSRPNAPLRICIIGPEFADPNPDLKLAAVSTFLSISGWPGAVPQVANILDRFASVTDQVALDLDIFNDGQIAPKLGIELYQRFDTAASFGSRLSNLITRLSDSGLCLPEKATGLFAWGGLTHERLHPQIWPPSLILARTLRGAGESSTFFRWLHHVKIVLGPNTPPTAKAYLAVNHAFLTDSTIHDALQHATFNGKILTTPEI